MGARTEKFGTIFSRLDSLLRTGTIRWEDRPIWYDVYAVFRPQREPTFDSVATANHLRSIIYPEDNVRARFYKEFGVDSVVGAFDLSNNWRPSHCETFINKYYELMNTQNKQNEVELFETTRTVLEATGLQFAKKQPPKNEAAD